MKRLLFLAFFLLLIIATICVRDLEVNCCDSLWGGVSRVDDQYVWCEMLSERIRVPLSKFDGIPVAVGYSVRLKVCDGMFGRYIEVLRCELPVVNDSKGEEELVYH